MFLLLLCQQKILTKLLNEGFKRPIYWNEYKVTPNKTIELGAINDVKYIRELLGSSCQGVKRLFVLAYNNTAGNDYIKIHSNHFHSFKSFFTKS